MYIHIHTYTYIHIYMYIYMYIHICIYSYIFIYTCMYICIYTCVYIYIYVYICICMHNSRQGSSLLHINRGRSIIVPGAVGTVNIHNKTGIVEFLGSTQSSCGSRGDGVIVTKRNKEPTTQTIRSSTKKQRTSNASYKDEEIECMGVTNQAPNFAVSQKFVRQGMINMYIYIHIYIYIYICI